MNWISVKDRLPDVFGLYLTLDEFGIYIQRWKGLWETEYPVNESTVTHWMPLPEPPK